MDRFQHVRTDEQLAFARVLDVIEAELVGLTQGFATGYLLAVAEDVNRYVAAPGAIRGARLAALLQLPEAPARDSIDASR